MKKFLTIIAGLWLCHSANASDPSLTIYNQNFALVRETVGLQVKKGVNPLSFSEVTAHVEPDSLVLRDLSGKQGVRILEQSYRADPISQGLLLSLYEGETLSFIERQHRENEEPKIIQGKVIRSGYTPHREAYGRYGNAYAIRQGGYASDSTPIIEVDGKLRFGLPGEPIFSELKNDTILKPTLTWLLEAGKDGKVDAELSYITGGMSWESSYNVVGNEKTDEVEIIGWVTVDNQSGRTFADTKLKLMAGDVSKIKRDDEHTQYNMVRAFAASEKRAPQDVTQKDFDEYHLYTLERKTTLRDRETKQIEFLRASGVKSKKVFVYRALGTDLTEYLRSRYGYNDRRPNTDEGQTVAGNKKVWIMREFKNSEENRLGMPLPKGKVRFYQKGEDKQTEFIGENTIDHTPKNEMIRLYTGNAFDLKAERKRTEFKRGNDWMDEKIEITLRNHKKEAAEIRVIEDLIRWNNWEIKEKSHEYLKTDSQTIEFRVVLKPEEEKAVSYFVHYSW